MPTVEVILKEQIKGLGAEADIVKVRAGYARNFLVPQGKALEASRDQQDPAESRSRPAAPNVKPKS